MSNDQAFYKSLKPLCIEEFLDFYFYRRVAYRMVPILHKLKMTPNQVTTVSLIFGLFASYAVFHQHFIAAALLALIAIFFDCCDGQLARLTGQTSPLGRAMDGFFDFIWITCFWLAVYFSNYFQDNGHAEILAFMLCSSASMIVHCWRFDGVKLKKLEITGENFSENDMDIQGYLKLGKAELKRFNLLAVLLVVVLCFQMYFFVRGNEKKKTYERSPEERDYLNSRLEPILSQWSWLGEGHHNTLVILGCFLTPWTPYGLLWAFGFILIPMNLWWLYCEFKWHREVKVLQKFLA